MTDAGGGRDSSGSYDAVIEDAAVGGAVTKGSNMEIVISSGQRTKADREARRKAKEDEEKKKKDASEEKKNG